MSGNQWDPVHFEDHDGSTEPAAEPAKPGGMTPRRRKKPTTPKAQAPVNLALELPKRVVDGIWAVAEQQKRTALAIEENTKALTALVAELKAKSAS